MSHYCSHIQWWIVEAILIFTAIQGFWYVLIHTDRLPLGGKWMLPTKEEPRRPGYFNTCVSIHVYKKLVMGMYMLAAGNSTCVFPFFVLDLRGWEGMGANTLTRALPKTQSVEYWKIGRYCNCFHVRIHLAPILLHTLPRWFVRDCLQSQSCVLATNAPKSSKHPQESWAKISAYFCNKLF